VKPTLQRVLVVAALALAALGVWKLTWWVAGDLVGSPSPAQRLEDEAAPAEAEALRLRVLSSLGETRTISERALRLELELPAGHEPARVAEALADQLRDPSRVEGKGVEVYVTHPNELDAEVRVYLGAELVQHLVLRPTVSRSSPPTHQRWQDRPLVALVVTDLGESGSEGQAVIQAPIPLTVAIRPFEAFSLVLAEQATRGLKEVLLQVDETASTELLVPAVPYASGTLLRAPLAGVGAAALAREHHYILNGGGQLDAATQHDLRRHELPSLAVTESLVGPPEDWSERVLHLAERHGAVVLTVSVDQPEHREAIRWLNSQRSRVKPAFAAEALRAARESPGGR
jgi:hypothetical protein